MLPFSSEIKIKAIDYVIDGAYKYTHWDTHISRIGFEWPA